MNEKGGDILLVAPPFLSHNRLTKFPSYFTLHVRWLRLLTRITDLCQLIGLPQLAAFLQCELSRVLLIDFSLSGLITDASTPNYRLRSDGHYDLTDAASSFQKSALVGACVGFPSPANGFPVPAFSSD
jgi:hypothetical protein